MITTQQLKTASPSLSDARAKIILPVLIDVCQRYGITRQSLPFFLANIIHESGGFTIMAENLNYTTPGRLVAVWPSRFSLTKVDDKYLASSYVKNPDLLGNLVYNGRMGNRPKSNDGYTFRGGGFAQITGRDAYQAYTDFINSKNPVKLSISDIAGRVQSDVSYAMDAAGWFFSVFKKLNGMTDLRKVVKLWNGGHIGMAERQAIFNRCRF